MQSFSISPLAIVVSLLRHRELIRASIKRDILGRYRGSMLGLLWSFVNPLLMLAVYTFVFGTVFNARWNQGSGATSEFALLLFAGMIVFNLFAECVNRAPLLVVSTPNYVKKVIFPLEILPLCSLGTALFHCGISLLVWLIGYGFLFGVPPLTAVFAPLVLLPLAVLILGLSWMLASLGVYLRDVGQIIGQFTSVLMFLSPVFYPASALPGPARVFMEYNPLTPAMELIRDVLYFGKPPDFLLLGTHFVVAILFASVGFAWFQKTRKGFADVL